MKLENKTAIVTGARRGIGKAIAVKLAEEGANVVVSDIDQQDCEKVVKEIKQLGTDALAVKCDVSKKEDVSALVKKTMDKFGTVDILVNNAGIYRPAPITDTSEDLWDSTLDINLKGFYLCTRAVADQMIKQEDGGSIISVSSIAGKVGVANSSAYCASKAGIIGMTRELALELAPKGIRVNSIAPGLIETPMTAGMMKDPETKKSFLSQIPMARAGQPEEIGKAAVFLASEDSSYVTGHTIVVDGGWIAH